MTSAGPFQRIRVNSKSIGRWLESADITDLSPADLQLLRQELNQTIESLDFQEAKHRKAAEAGGPSLDGDWVKRVGVKRRVTRLALAYIAQVIDDRQRQAIAAKERQLAQVLLRHGLPTDPQRLDAHLSSQAAAATPIPVVIS